MKFSTPTHIYLNVVRQYFRLGYSMEHVDMKKVANGLRDRGYRVDADRGTIRGREALTYPLEDSRRLS